MTLTASDAVRAAETRALHAETLPARLRFSTDTRTIAPGDAFVALRGERFDGHDYVRDAVAAGAAAVVVSDAAVVPDNVAAFVVPDTTAAYLAFGAAARRGSRARFVALTGSTGKTTTKELLAQILQRTVAGRVVATPANENNAIGVAKLLLNLPDDAAYVVVEFGARHYGEIEPLARATLPDVAVLTNVGDAHLEIMGSHALLAETKWGIFATGAQAVLNADDAESRRRAASLAGGITWFATDRRNPTDMPLRRGETLVSLSAAGEEAALHVGDDRFICNVQLPGAHNLLNAAAAAAAAVAVGIAPRRVAAALSVLTLPPGRYERLAASDYTFVYDAYNASMSGTLATLGAFANERAARRIVVLGSMAELGAEAAAMHARVGAAAAHSNLAALLVGGDYASDIARGAREAGYEASRIVPFAANAAAVSWLMDNARPGDLVLLKASRRYKLEEIVAGVRAAHAS